MLNPPRLILTLALAACFACGLAGCTQEKSGDSTAFNDLPQTPPQASEKAPTEAHAASDNSAPLVAPLPADTAEDAPLVAVKPILASSSADLKNVLKSGAAAKAREIKLLVPEKSFGKAKYEGENLIRISYDDFDLLKVLNMEPVPANADKFFPEWLKHLDGKRVRLRGFMYPQSMQEGIAGFAFVRDNQICCFGRSPKVYDIVDVFLKDGVTTHYIPNRPFDVVGTFRIEPEPDGNEMWRLYTIEDAVVVER